MADGSSAKKRLSPVLWVLIGVVVGVAVAAAVWGIYTLLAPKTIQVPNVVGEATATAQTRLEAAGLKMTVQEVFDPKAVEGQIFNQDPGAGTDAKPGSTVLVTVSKGAKTVDVPDLVGMTSEDAISKLKSVGLRAGDVTREYDPKLARDLVIRSDPRKFEKLAKGEAVDLVVSRGVHLTQVPSVIGKSTSVARRLIGNAGLNPDVNPQPSSSTPAGTVMSQDPAAGEDIPINSTVSITVSSGPPMITMPDVRKMGGVAARNKLESLGLVVQSDFVPDKAKVVVKQSPNPGTQLQKSSTVKIYIGDGSGP